MKIFNKSSASCARGLLDGAPCIRLYWAYLFLLVLATISSSNVLARPDGVVVANAENLVSEADTVVEQLEREAEYVENHRITFPRSMYGNGDFRTITDSARAKIKLAMALNDRIRKSYRMIRRSLTTMGDFQIYQGLLTGLILSSENLIARAQNLRFELNVLGNERISKRAEFLTWLGLVMAFLGVVLCVCGYGFQRPKKVSSNNFSKPSLLKMKRLNIVTILIIIITIGFVILTIFYGPLNTNNPSIWAGLMIAVYGLTLAFLCQYVVDTNKLMRYQAAQLANSQKPIVGLIFNMERDPTKNNRHDHGFFVNAKKSPVHASVLVNINAMLNGKPVHFNPKYDGQEPWPVQCYEGTYGHFTIESILSAVHLEEPISVEKVRDDIMEGGPLKDTELTLAIKLEAKRWDADDSEYEGLPPYEYEYDFKNERFKFRL